MPLPLVTVTASLSFGNGETPASAILRFTPSAVDASGSDVLLPSYFDAAIVDGAASVEVCPTAAGRGITYLVQAILAFPEGAQYPEQQTHTLASRLQIPDEDGPFVLAELLNLDALPPISQTALQQMTTLRNETVAAAEAASDASTAASAAEVAELKASEASQSEINAASSAAQAAASEGAAADSADASALSAAAAAGSAIVASDKSLEASQFRDEASDAAAAASAAADRVDLGELDEAVASTGADAVAAAASATASAASAAQSEVSRVYADASASAARSARDAAFVNANVFADIATGRAAVADGQQFQVVTGDEIIRYRRDSSSTQTEVARYPAGQTVVALDGALGQLAAILGQTYEEVDRLSAAQEGDVYTLRTLLEMISVVGQLADQINGGQVALRGGSLADPALRIGTAGIYSSAADTLSVAIAGVERLRVTASGITIYGTVTEA